MSNGIAFLDDLRDDLMEAAAQAEQRTRGTTPRSPRIHRPMSRWKLASGLVAGIVVIVGVVGYIAVGHPGSITPASREVEFGGPGTHPNPDTVDVPGQGGDRVQLRGRNPFAFEHGGVEVPKEGVPASSQVAGVPAVGPNIVKMAALEIQVDRHTFSAQFQKAMAVADSYGGYVQTSSTSGTKTRTGIMVMRVPADKFALAVGDLRALGTVLHQEISGVDVTAQFVDLGARLQNALAQEASMRRLLGRAPTVAATLRVNSVLSDVELRIEELQGQLRVLRNRSDLGTIKLDMREKGAQASPIAPPPPPVKKPQLSRAFDKAVAGFLGVIFSVVVGLGYMLPVLVLLVVAWFVVRRVRRTRMATA
jgi:hypothetical protein